ncbi:hypothetical protein AAFC00_005299 [Neodothiora populina]|uniref:Delta 8-(E)-sphingolipid desaturase n=1 Tax=Neodothiora populina TaxID=2781224 RepID=A0ABR3PKS8_9PEZI
MSGASVARNGRRERVYRRDEIEAMIADGNHIFILDDKVMKVDAWLKYHPGGDKAIKHMIGRDATDEAHAIHSAGTLKRMDNFQIGRINGPWLNFLPPIQGGHFRPLEITEEATAFATSTALELEEQDSSSRESSAEPSPVFDPANGPHMRSRKSHAESTSSSASSISSLDVEEKTTQETTSENMTRQAIEHDLKVYPALDVKTQANIMTKYRELQKRIEAEGLYECRYTSYLIEACRYTLFFVLCLTFLHYGWYKTSGLFLGIFWHQLVFTAHDTGHVAVTHNYQIDSTIGMIVADWLGGLSLGWWKRSHNVHHIITNSCEHDPDIQHLPFFAVSHRFMSSLRSTYYDRIMSYDAFAKIMINYQHFLYYPILCFGRFNLYRLSWEYILLGLGPRKGPAAWHRWFELAGQIFFWYWFGYQMVYKCIPNGWDRFAFVMISHIVTMPVHVQITLSHFAMSTADLGVTESFPQRMLRTTMDVDCPQWLDFFHGGLQFQAIHHLYPRIPRHNLRRTQKLVMQFCKDVGIPYAIYGFGDGNGKIIGKLGDVAKQARILAECQRVIVESGEMGH